MWKDKRQEEKQEDKRKGGEGGGRSVREARNSNCLAQQKKTASPEERERDGPPVPPVIGRKQNGEPSERRKMSFPSAQPYRRTANSTGTMNRRIKVRRLVLFVSLRICKS